MKRIALLVVLLATSIDSWAASPWSGVWLMRQSSPKFQLTMTVEEVGPGWKIIDRIPVPDAKGGATYSVMSVETKLDGKDVPNPIDGKPSGQTMDIRKVDDRHTFTVIKFQGKQVGVSKSEVSPDGKVIKTENDFAVSGPSGVAGKRTQYWDKQ